jgi:rhamnosyltransferase
MVIMNNSKVTPELPRVLVLLAARNGEKWIEEQLDSILSQSEVELFVVVQDDCSTDRTVEIVREKYCVPHTSQFMLVQNQVATGSAGGNFKKLFVESCLASFDYVALSDQDDVWLPHKLRDAIRALQESGAQGYSSVVEAFWPNGRKSTLAQSRSVRAADFLFEGAGQGCSFVIPMATFVSVQDFCRANLEAIDKFHYHDWLIYVLVRAWGGVWFFDSRPSMRYRQHSGNEIGARGSFYSVSRRLRLLSSGWYKAQVTIALNVFARGGGASLVIDAFRNRFLAPDSFARRVYLLAFTLRHGRRKLVDRCALFFFSLSGWL